jgi:hypothetical protein
MDDYLARDMMIQWTIQRPASKSKFIGIVMDGNITVEGKRHAADTTIDGDFRRSEMD